MTTNPTPVAPVVLFPGASLVTALPAKRRLIVAVDGLDKQGKTHFAMTAPSPILYLDFDLGSEGVVSKFVKGEVHGVRPKPHLLYTGPFMIRPSAISFDEDNEKQANEKIMAVSGKMMDQFRETYANGFKLPAIGLPDGRVLPVRTIVVDTGGEAWELLRLAKFGRLSQVKPHHYTEVNGIMRDLVRAGFEHDVNVIWLHKMKAEWKESAEGKARKSGVLERQGFTDMAFLVQANLLCYRAPKLRPQEWKWRAGEGLTEFTADPRTGEDDLGFRVRVGNTRHNPTLEGLELSNEMATFATFAQLMLPDSSPEDWADLA